MARIAIVSYIHGNLPAFEAVLADLRETSPDLILHGGDLANGGASPSEVVDLVRSLGWEGVIGNGDELIAMPESLARFAQKVPAVAPLVPIIEEVGSEARERLGEERVAWLGALPPAQYVGPIALVHASPGDCWISPFAGATDVELAAVYRPLGRAIAVYGHIHQPFIRELDGLTVVNSGSVGQSYDGDPRASYLLLDDSTPTIRRVEYDVGLELAALAKCGLPHTDWMARIIETGFYQPPNLD